MLQVFFSVGLTNLNALQNAELELTLKEIADELFECV